MLLAWLPVARDVLGAARRAWLQGRCGLLNQWACVASRWVQEPHTPASCSRIPGVHILDSELTDQSFAYSPFVYVLPLIGRVISESMLVVPGGCVMVIVMRLSRGGRRTWCTPSMYWPSSTSILGLVYVLTAGHRV